MHFFFQKSPFNYILSKTWFSQWQSFVEKKTTEPPGPIDNSKINPDTVQITDNHPELLISDDVWNFFHSIYGGGPLVKYNPKPLPDSDIKDVSEEEQEDENIFFIPTLKHRTDERYVIYISQAKPNYFLSIFLQMWQI